MTKSIAKKSTTGSLPPAVPLAITPTFSPWTHTSDDSYIYQLSLVLATATVSSDLLYSLLDILHITFIHHLSYTRVGAHYVLDKGATANQWMVDCFVIGQGYGWLLIFIRIVLHDPQLLICMVSNKCRAPLHFKPNIEQRATHCSLALVLTIETLR